MANLTLTTVAVVMPTENFTKFMEAFPGSDEYFNARKTPTTLDCYFDEMVEYDTNAMNTYYKFNIECKWTIRNLVYPTFEKSKVLGYTYTEQHLALKDLCKDCGVIKLIIHSTEPGVGIEEMIEYEKGDDGVTYTSRLMYPEPTMDIDDFPTKIRIIHMDGEPQYDGKEGIVESVDDEGQLHGTWGGCAVNPEVDKYEVLDGTEAGD